MSMSIAVESTHGRAEQQFSPVIVAALLSLFFVCFYNAFFFRSVIDLVGITNINGALFIANLSILLWLVTFIFIYLVTIPYVVNILFPIVFFAASCTAYFMDTYGVVIHKLMVQNVMETDIAEVKDLLNVKLALYIVALGLLPSIVLWRIRIRYGSAGVEVWNKLKYISISLIVCVILILSMSMDYASFFRNHKSIRQSANPLNFIYATGSYAASLLEKDIVIKPIENDAKISAFGVSQVKPTLLVLVVGETARADHFGINGYERDTTPLLAQQNIINFPRVTSCGTETAVSVPCMFSNLGRRGYSDSKAKSQEGLLDVVSHAGVDVLWRDNNSSCKGTCNRVTSEDMQRLRVSEVCNSDECYDEILLHDLDSKVFPVVGSKLLILHQKGSHGPDYHKRYPKDHTFFSPVCQTNQLQDCTREEVINAFDNTIRYTDYFLNKTIEWVKQKNSQYNTALIYMSDHGESLGEKHLYLHGMPYGIAPKAQKHVPLIMWMSDEYVSANHINKNCLHNLNQKSYSHDNLFHTVLGLLHIETSVLNRNLDILNTCRS